MTKFRYIGNGEFYRGIPTKDVSSDDLSAEQLEVVKNSSLYQKVGSSKVSKKKKEEVNGSSRIDETS